MTTNEMTPRETTPNVGGLRNGSRIERLSLGSMPAKLERIQRSARQYRNALEAAVLARHGGIDLMAAHSISLAATAEMQAQVCLWLLRNKLETMSTSDVLSCTAAMTKARDRRNSAVAALKLPPPTAEEQRAALYSQLYDQPPAAAPAASQEAGPTAETTRAADAATGLPCDSSGDINQDTTFPTNQERIEHETD